MEKNNWQRRAVFFYLAFDMIVFYLYSTRRPDDHFSLSFFSFRIAFVILVLLMNIVRKRQSFYVPVLSDMPDKSYWSYALAVAIILGLVVRDHFVPLTPFLEFIVLYAASAALSSIVFKLYQQAWMEEKQREYKETIESIRQKASLTAEELDAVSDELSTEAAKTLRPPLLWRLLSFFILVTIGVMLSYIATWVLDSLESAKFILPDILIP